MSVGCHHLLTSMPSAVSLSLSIAKDLCIKQKFILCKLLINVITFQPTVLAAFCSFLLFQGKEGRKEGRRIQKIKLHYLLCGWFWFLWLFFALDCIGQSERIRNIKGFFFKYY